MDKTLLHQQLYGKMASGCPKDSNILVVQDPTVVIDCTPEGDYENFKHVVNGDSLVYAELMNSVPIDGHRIADGFERLSMKNGFAFDDEGLERMKKSMEGMEVIRYDEYGLYNEKLSGKVYDAWLLQQCLHGRKYHKLCMLAWIKCGFFDKHPDFIMMCYRLYSFRHTCGICGAKASYYFSDDACEHMRKMRSGCRVPTIVSIDQIDACGGLYVSQYDRNSVLPRESANMCSLKNI